MTITSYGTGAYRAATRNSMVSTRAEMEDLQRQLATQKRATSYGDLGVDRRVSLDLNAKLSSLDTWLGGIQLADVNLKLSSTAVENFGKLISEARNDTRSNTYVASSTGRTGAQVLAEEKLKQSLDMLNSSVNGRYLFSGQTSDVEPTVSFDEIMNGDGAGKAGVTQLIAERKEADLGSGLGRLTTSLAGTTSTISEEAAGLPYGFKLAGMTSSSAALAVSTNAGPPLSYGVDVAAQPAVGDKVTINLTLPDGTQEAVVLTARAPGTTANAADSFEIGADVNATAANLQASIAAGLGREAKTTLAAASATVAAKDFFAGSINNPPVRVPGPPFATATAAPSNAGSANTTVIWYRGDDGIDPLAAPPVTISPSARSTATVQVDSGQVVATGARANEEAFRIGLAQFAVMTSETFPAGDADSQGRYEAMVARVGDNLGFGGGVQSPTEIITEFGSAQTSLARAKERHETTKNYLTTALSNVEDVSKEEVAVQILALQTQLQASYETTSILSKLTLTNYL